ncbi:MAG: HAMP domain-containing protein [Anaerolineae bacterium]|nr:HAMP domain-containing protein [Anaerolineae bacterium]
MCYRSVKRLLGETSLERKCRFLFGGGLMLLITGSFYFYAKLNLRIIREQTREQASLLVAPSILAYHAPQAGLNEDYLPIFQEVADALQAAPDYTFELLRPLVPQGREASADSTTAYIPPADKRAGDRSGRLAVQELMALYEEARKETNPQSDQPADVPLEKTIENTEDRKFEYYQVVLAGQKCVVCHAERQGNPDLKVGDMLGVAHISMPLVKTNREVQKNNAILIAMALITASLAMAAAYAIVRYVIVKPVLHLKDVSDAIAHGELDQRADIRTGDEFEELSHAFNRMLRHLVTVQDELKHVNNNLDAKVDELAQANLSLHEMNKIKSEFLATMSHELRTPLNGIIGYAHILNRDPSLNPSQASAVKVIQASGRHLLTLIDDILDLSKIEARKMELYPTDFHLPNFLEGIVSMFHIRAHQKQDVDFTYEKLTVLPPIIHADEKRLRQILINLLGNAIKFTEQGEVIFRVGLLDPHTQAYLDQRDAATTAISASETLRFEIIDTGIGISPDQLPRIFLPFEQVSEARYRAEGTGLGLAITKNLIDAMGGQLGVESELGRGSDFRLDLTFPVVWMTPHTQPSAAALETIAGSGDSLHQRLRVNEVRPDAANLKPVEAKLIPPPPEEMAILYDLAMKGELLRLKKQASQIEQMGDQYQPFAARLAQLVDNFDEDQIWKLIEQFLTE